jgi:hypothetical protein
VQRVSDPRRGGAGVPDLPRVPGGFPPGMPAADDAASMGAAVPPYWQAWPSGVPTGLMGGAGTASFY